MTRAELSKQEEHLFAVLSGRRFLQMEGLSNEVPFFIYPYDPEDAIEVAKSKKRIKNRLANKGIEVCEINIYDLSVEILKERGVWDRLLAFEPEQDKADFRELLQGMLDPELHIAPAIRAKLAKGNFDVFFLTGIGEVFPYIRSHNVLNNLQSVVTGKPMLMFFPGRYEQSDTLGSSLVLFGRLKDDQYYRAKNILEQEA
ncbi:BREX protein BrxB domain-containing protein [Catellatospora sp. NPDC049133]|uniref:BREX protein BrxB domain-containing protein n=1 Tax=Catellatospora sp. NPDC049133 TaxID=3155499 RepID=UPI0033E1E578